MMLLELETPRKGEAWSLFRFCMLGDIRPVEETPWRTICAKDEYPASDPLVIPQGDTVILSYLLRGHLRAHAFPRITDALVAAGLPQQLFPRTNEFVFGLLRQVPVRFQPFDGPAMLTMNPSALLIRRTPGVVAFVDRSPAAVASRVVNALTWRAPDTVLRLDVVTPSDF